MLSFPGTHFPTSERLVSYPSSYLLAHGRAVAAEHPILIVTAMAARRRSRLLNSLQVDLKSRLRPA